MASSEKFKTDFATVLRRRWGEEEVSDDRIWLMWRDLKHLPDSILEKCARIVVAKSNKFFPGVDKVIEISREVFAEESKGAVKKIIPNYKCACGGTGIRVVDNYAFQCQCPAGKENYPLNPAYSGQVPFKDIRTENEEVRLVETRTHVNIFDKKTGSWSFRIKENPWRDHNSRPEQEEFGPIKAIPERDR